MTGELQQRVGQHLRAHRHSLGLSQDAFAAVVGMHRTWIGALERGERNLTLQSVEELAEAIGVDPLELLTESQETT